MNKSVKCNWVAKQTPGCDRRRLTTFLVFRIVQHGLPGGGGFWIRPNTQTSTSPIWKRCGVIHERSIAVLTVHSAENCSLVADTLSSTSLMSCSVSLHWLAQHCCSVPGWRPAEVQIRRHRDQQPYETQSCFYTVRQKKLHHLFFQ